MGWRRASETAVPHGLQRSTVWSTWCCQVSPCTCVCPLVLFFVSLAIVQFNNMNGFVCIVCLAFWVAFFLPTCMFMQVHVSVQCTCTVHVFPLCNNYTCIKQRSYCLLYGEFHFPNICSHWWTPFTYIPFNVSLCRLQCVVCTCRYLYIYACQCQCVFIHVIFLYHRCATQYTCTCTMYIHCTHCTSIVCICSVVYVYTLYARCAFFAQGQAISSVLWHQTVCLCRLDLWAHIWRCGH